MARAEIFDRRRVGEFAHVRTEEKPGPIPATRRTRRLSMLKANA